MENKSQSNPPPFSLGPSVWDSQNTQKRQILKLKVPREKIADVISGKEKRTLPDKEIVYVDDDGDVIMVDAGGRAPHF